MKWPIFLLWMLSLMVSAVELDSLPADSEQYLYGFGVDQDYEQATHQALADITRRLSTRIQSTGIIEQQKSGNVVQASTRLNIRSSSLAIELANVTVLERQQGPRGWQVLVQVERALMQQGMRQQLDTLRNATQERIDAYINTPGPACWVALRHGDDDRRLMQQLALAVVGSGGSSAVLEPIEHTLAAYRQLNRQCQKLNRYRLQFSGNIDSTLKEAINDKLTAEDIQLTTHARQSGRVTLKLIQKNREMYGNYMVFITFSIKIFDENDRLLFKTQIAKKGASLSSNDDAYRQSMRQLVRGIEQAQIDLL